MDSIRKVIKRINRGQKGQMVAFLLILLGFGGVTIGASLNFTTTIMKDTSLVRNKTFGIYSADAGVDYAIWTLENGGEIPETLDESVNDMTVDLDYVDRGLFTMYCGELEYVGSLPVHFDWITVNGTGVSGYDTCNYTISVYWNGDASAERKLTEIGATLPPGYTYVSGSSADFPSNVTTDDPDEIGQAPGGAQWVKWTWHTGHGPQIGDLIPELTQTFTISGTGEIEGDYCWVTSQTGDIGLVGEITGQRYTITGTATDPDTDTVTSQVDADILLLGGTVYISSWQIMR